MGGTRYKARGIDHDGNCANHTEIEQLVFQHEAHSMPKPVENNPYARILATTKVYSHVQVRGSIPVFWEQTGLTTVNITQPNSDAGEAMVKHFASL
jgi:hypothetical protein